MPESDYRYHQKITTLGGGTGQFNLLRGLVKLNHPSNNAAICATWDSGGSSGKLRVEEGVLPPGDYMQNLIAQMEDDDQLQSALILLTDRRNGHPLRNLLAGEAERAYHGVEGGIDGLRRFWRIRGRVIPISTIDLDLCGTTKNGVEIGEESNLDVRVFSDKNDPDFTRRIYFNRPALPNPQALQTIAESEKIIFSPGSPNTSVFPCLQIWDIAPKIRESTATLCAVLNIMTSPHGEAPNLTSASKWLKEFQHYLGDPEVIRRTGHTRLDYLLVNDNNLDPEILDIYRQQGQMPIEVDDDECLRLAPGLKIIHQHLAHYDKNSHLLRHDQQCLAETLLKLPVYARQLQLA